MENYQNRALLCSVAAFQPFAHANLVIFGEENSYFL